MTTKFRTYPAGRDIYFVRATMDDVEWLMSEYPVYWEDQAGSSPFFREERPDIQFRKIFEGKTTPQDWLHLLQFQNVYQRLLFVDVDLPGWIALVADSFQYFRTRSVTEAVHCNAAERDGFLPVDDPNGVAQIHVKYRMREPSLQYDRLDDGDFLQVDVASTTMGSQWVRNSSYVSGRDWYLYSMKARGVPGFDGLDVPLGAVEIPDHVRAEFPSYFRQFSKDTFHVGAEWKGLQDDPEAAADFLKVLPFDHRGQERVVDFFNSTLVSQWLENTYGIRWNDPSFYEGESLLYIVGGPDVVNDPFTPRIPLEDYYRFQAIDLERNRKLIERGKF